MVFGNESPSHDDLAEPKRYFNGLNLVSDQGQSHCGCVDNLTGETFNFCYQHPHKPFHIGKKFSCRWLPYLKNLGLFEPMEYVQTKDLDHLKPAFVTAADKGFFDPTITSIVNFQSHFPGETLIVYDLGFTQEQADQIKTSCNVEYRKFPLEKFPDYVGNLIEYRFKFYIVAEVLRKNKAAWWLDTSVYFKSGNLGAVYPRSTCENATTAARISGMTDHPSVTKKSHQIQECQLPSALVFISTGHSNYATTEPEMYSYFPTNIEVLREVEQFGGGFFLIYRTEEVMKGLIYWMVLCSFEKHCMAPVHSNRFCEFKDRLADHIYKCHRFDQSAFNLLLANMFHNKWQHYSKNINSLYDIRRGQVSSVKPKMCST